jgi:hypothetical protein
VGSTRQRGREALTGGTQVSTREREGSGYPFGFCPGWAVGASAAGPNRFPSAFFYFFISFLFSLF